LYFKELADAAKSEAFEIPREGTRGEFRVKTAGPVHAGERHAPQRKLHASRGEQMFFLFFTNCRKMGRRREEGTYRIPANLGKKRVSKLAT
jgi:hypothetical protein